MPVADRHNPLLVSGGFSVLRSTACRPATKRFSVDRSGRVRKIGYGNERFFSVTPYAANGIKQLATLLGRLQRDPRSFIVRGAPRPTTDLRRARRLLHDDPKTGEPATIEATDRAWIMVDLDGVVCPAGLDPRVPEDADELIAHLVGLLPAEFHNASCFWRWSASQSVPECLGQEPPDELRAHLYFWLDRRVPDSELRRWATGLKRRSLPIDPTVFAPVQPHYIAAPIFDGFPDPLQRRSGFRRGLVEQVALMLPPPEHRPPFRDGQGVAYDGAGLRFHLDRIGPEGYQQPIKSAIAACFAEHGDDVDDERLKQAIRSRIDEVESDHPRGASELARYRSDRFLDDKILWTRAREQQRRSTCSDAGRSLPPYFGNEATDRDETLAAQSAAISGWLERHLRIVRARREIDRRRDEARAGAGVAKATDPETETRRRMAAISRQVRRDVLAELDLERLPKDGERLLVTGAQGTGKSRTVAGAIAAMSGEVTIRWLVPTLDKAEEQVCEYRRFAGLNSPDAVVVRGRGAPDPKQPGEAMCPRHLVVNRAAAMRVDVQEVICRTCALRSRCGYQRQREALKAREHGLFLATSDYLWIPCPAPRPDLLVVDESVIGKACETISLDPYRLTEDDKWASRDLDLALRNRRTATSVRTAITQHQGRELAHLREQGVTDDDLGAALKHLASRDELRPEVDGRMPDAAIAKALDAAELRETMKVLILFRQVRREIAQPRARLNSISFDPAARVVVNGVAETSPRIFAGYVRAPRLKRTMPVLALDGTGSLLLNRKVFGAHMTGQHFPVPRDAEVVQVRGKTFSRQSLAGPRNIDEDVTRSKQAGEAERLRDRVIDLLETLPGKVLLVTYKRVEEILRPGLPARIEVAHFGAVRGLNSFQHCETVVILGREQPGPQAIERMTRAFAATDDEPLIPFGCYVEQCRAHRLRGGEAPVEVVPVHPDPRCQEMLEQVREAEIVQAVDRVRPVFNRRRVVLLTNLLLDITVDRVLSWQELQPSRFTVAFARHGVLPLSPHDLAAAFPDLWSSADSAKKDLQREAKTGDKLQIRTSIWGLSPINCIYRRSHQRGPSARAVLQTDLVNPRRVLDRLIGPLSMFETEPEQHRQPCKLSTAHRADDLPSTEGVRHEQNRDGTVPG